jgi:D-lactate dehydrogenase
MSDEVIRNDVLERLLTFPNVLVTGHQARCTKDELTSIAETRLFREDGQDTPGRNPLI